MKYLSSQLRKLYVCNIYYLVNRENQLLYVYYLVFYTYCSPGCFMLVLTFTHIFILKIHVCEQNLCEQKSVRA